MKRSLFLLGMVLSVALTLPIPATGVEVLTFHPQGSATRVPVIEVAPSPDGNLRVSLELPELTIDHVGESHTLGVPGGQAHGAPGEPALPSFTRYLQVAPGAEVSCEILDSQTETFSNYRVAPMGDVPDPACYARDIFLGGEPVSLGNVCRLGDLRVIPITFRPVEYNPVRGEVRVTHHLELEITGGAVALSVEPARAPSPGMERIYEAVVANYARSGDASPHLGTYVIISRHQEDVTELLQPLLEWRRRMGYNVVHVTTATTGTDPQDIQAWLREAYATWEYPPRYVVIVGDVTGGFPIGTFYETYSGIHGEGDHPYSQLGGDDIVPDAFVGRLSAETEESLELIVHKIVSYESAPYMQDTSWFRRACLTGDPSTSGITCVQIQQWIKQRMLSIGYAQIDTVFTYPFESTTLDYLDNGDSFFGYRGYYHMSGIGADDILTLENGDKMPFAVNLTCGTGSFAYGTSRNEAWLRAGLPPDTPTGGIGSIGTATTGTHTRYNNCFYTGTVFGLFYEGQTQLGAAQLRGKLEMLLNYSQYEMSQAARYCYWNSLMGDPATDMWTGVPEMLTVDYPPVVPMGSGHVRVTVRDEEDSPIENAWVFLYREGAIAQGSYTDAAGVAEIPIDASIGGTVLLTVTGHNLYPHQGNFDIATVDRYVTLESHSVDDGDDGQANPGETFDLHVELKNHGTQSAEDVTLTLSSSDPYVGVLEGGPLAYGTLDPGASGLPAAPARLRVSPLCPAVYSIPLLLEVASQGESWTTPLELAVTGPDLTFAQHTLHGVGARLDPGESGTLTIHLENISTYTAEGPIQATLSSGNYAMTITDAAGTYPTVAPGGVEVNDADHFGFTTPADCRSGEVANLTLHLTFADGTRDVAVLDIPVGVARSTDPTGPDAYGYLAYDITDVNYPQAPVFDWEDINPAYGGPGVWADLNDWGFEQDDSRVLPLPFEFTFYGHTFDEVTVCSNGWIAMGATYLTNYRNWRLPSAGGPDNMIAPFWDNLYQAGNGRVCYWHDEAGGRFIVAWDHMHNQRNGSEISCEVILYDPVQYPTLTGDGEIVFQYEIYHDSDSVQMYSTTGIQNENHTVALGIRYYMWQPSTCEDLADGMAIRFTTGAPGLSGIAADRQSGPRLFLSSAPNPSRDQTTIRFQLPAPRRIAARIFDVDGRVVRTLADGSLAAGAHALDWRGRDERGLPVPSGTYYFRLEAEDEVETERLIRVR